MKKNYQYLLSTGPDMSHLFDVRHFAHLTDALELAYGEHSKGRAFRVERMEDGRKITDSKQYAKRLADEKRKAYCEKHGYKFIAQ